MYAPANKIETIASPHLLIAFTRERQMSYSCSVGRQDDAAGWGGTGLGHVGGKEGLSEAEERFKTAKITNREGRQRYKLTDGKPNFWAII